MSELRSFSIFSKLGGLSISLEWIRLYAHLSEQRLRRCEASAYERILSEEYDC
jgi:hypothetical protein